MKSFAMDKPHRPGIVHIKKIYYGFRFNRQQVSFNLPSNAAANMQFKYNAKESGKKSRSSLFYLFLADLQNFASRRVHKYIDSNEVYDRLDELKEDVLRNPDTLFVLIFDEAHSGCTKLTKNQVESPYGRIVNYWNSDDHTNVVAIMVTGEKKFLCS